MLFSPSVLLWMLNIWKKHVRTQLWCVTSLRVIHNPADYAMDTTTFHVIFLFFSIFCKWLIMYVILSSLYQIVFLSGQIYCQWKWLQIYDLDIPLYFIFSSFKIFFSIYRKINILFCVLKVPTRMLNLLTSCKLKCSQKTFKIVNAFRFQYIQYSILQFNFLKLKLTYACSLKHQNGSFAFYSAHFLLHRCSHFHLY